MVPAAPNRRHLKARVVDPRSSGPYPDKLEPDVEMLENYDMPGPDIAPAAQACMRLPSTRPRD